MKSKVYNLANVGEIVVCKHHKSQSLSIKIRHNQQPKVVIPTLMSFEMGYKFALEKEEWIISSLEKLSKTYRTKVITELKTRFHLIKVEKHNVSTSRVKKKGSDILVQIPNNKNIEDVKIQEQIKNFINKILRVEAKKYLPVRIHFFADKYGFKFNNIYIKNQKTRWGSCSSSNNINLNLHLMRLPERLSDYVILHELCHTVHKNHGKEFHKLLNTLVEDKRDLEKELKNYTTLL